MTMLQITIPNAPRFRASVTLENYPKLTDKFAKVSGKARKPTIKAEKRLFPLYGKHMNTKDYVKAFWELNFKAEYRTDCEAFYEPLSTQPQQWPAEPVFEALEPEDAPGPVHEALEPVLEALEPVLEALEPLAIPVLTTLTIEDTASLPAWLTRGIPPAWIK